MKSAFYVNLGPISLGKISKLLSADINGMDPEKKFDEFVGIDKIKNIDNTLSFIYENYIEKIDISKKLNLIISKKEKNKFSGFNNLIFVNNVHEAVAKLSSIFYRDINDDDIKENNPNKIGDDCIISNSAIIKKGVIIGKNSIIKDGVIINNNCILGENSLIEENVVISNSIIGDNVRIGRNTSIGQPGFGFAINSHSNYKIYHLGRVILQSNASIGSNCSIDRGSFGDTVIGENTFFDNMCHIAHNVVVGNNCIFAAMAGIAGSTRIGNSVMAGGQVGISGHLKIGNNVQIAAKSAVLKSIDDNSSVMGNPAIDKYKYIRKYKKFYG
tara:strand:- start:1258 stop:2241 length:984 start_codon:yes stop_codon:yes gene_type:complete